MQFNIIKDALLLIFLMYESVNDIKKKTVSIRSVIIFCIVAIVAMLLELASDPVMEIVCALMIRIAVGSFVLAAAKVTGGAIGTGDGLLLIGIGILVGWRECLMTLMLAGLFVFIVAGILLAAGKVTRKTRLPFIPFLSAGWIVTMVFG